MATAAAPTAINGEPVVGIVLYHSTSRRVLASIRQSGLLPHDPRMGRQESGVYLWQHREQAFGWAQAHARLKGIVLEITIPFDSFDKLHEDPEFFEEESEAYYFVGTVPPEWIKFPSFLRSIVLMLSEIVKHQSLLLGCAYRRLVMNLRFWRADFRAFLSALKQGRGL